MRIKRKSIAMKPIEGGIVDTINVQDKVRNAPSINLVQNMTGIPTEGIIAFDGTEEEIPEGYEKVENNYGIETITNENGTAIKFPDGTMICKGHNFYGSEPFVKNENVYYRQVTGATFPVPFVDVPTPSAQLVMGNIGAVAIGGGMITSTQILGFNIISAVEQARGIDIYWTAIGRWK